MLPLAKYRAPGDPVLLGQAGAISAAEFFNQAQELADALPAHGFVVNLCGSRHGFMLGFAAALLRGQTSLLPPGQGKRGWEPLLHLYPDAYLLGETAADGDPVFDLSTFMKAGGAARSGTTVLQLPQIDRAHKAAILFTSGSTGQPTAHGKTWEQLCQGAAGLAKVLDWAEIPLCAVVGSVPPQHMFGLESTVMLPWFTGAPVHMQNPLLPADLGAALRQSARPSWWMTTPLHLRAPLRGQTSLTGLAGILISTMSLPAPLASAAEAAWEVPVVEIYGSTETGALAARRTAIESHWVPLEGVSLRIETDCGDKGEERQRVWASGGHITPPVLLGDELDIQADGRFLWLGRASDLIKVGGKRASLSALNQHLTDIPGVDDGVCFFPENAISNAPDAALQQTDIAPHRLAALYVSSTFSPQEVLNALRTRIDPVFLPRPILRVAQLPRNANGKLPAASLADLYARCKTKSPAELPALDGVQDGVQYCTVPDAHPSIPGHFPDNPIVPGVVVLARVAQAIRSHFPHIELGALINVRFHAPLKPGESFCVRSRLQGECVRFDVQLATYSMNPESNSGAVIGVGIGVGVVVIASGRWAFSAPICNEATRQ